MNALLFWLMSYCTFSVFDESNPLIASGAQLTKISGQFSFTEGPARHPNGDVYFTDQPSDRIWIYKQTGQLHLFKEGTGRANGLYFHPDGTLWACSDERNEIRAYDVTSHSYQLKMPGKNQGKRYNGPNDLWIHPITKNVYFTDPFYARPYWDHKTPDLEKKGVYILRDGQFIPIVQDESLLQPNGIIGSPDGQFLYVTDIKDQKTYRYSIQPDGTLSQRILFTELGSDGMTIDAQGNIYLTGKGVTVFNPKGEKILHIPVPEPWTANVTFGGTDRKTLFITASKSVYTLQMQVAGR